MARSDEYPSDLEQVLHADPQSADHANEAECDGYPGVGTELPVEPYADEYTDSDRTD